MSRPPPPFPQRPGEGAVAGRELPDGVRDEIAELLGGPQGELDGILDAAEAAAVERREQAAVTAVARYVATEIDPFLGDLPNAPHTGWSADLATDKQREALQRAGLDELPEALSKGEASRWLGALAARTTAGLATLKQVRLLHRHGVDAKAMTFAEASAAIGTRALRWRKGRAA